MGDLVWVRFFFYLHTSGDRIFSLTYKAIVWQVFPCKIFFHSKSVCRIFFPEITQLPPSKVKESAPNKGEVQVTVNEFSRCSVLHALTFYLEIRQLHNFCRNDLQQLFRGSS